MKIAIFLLALVAVSLGYHINPTRPSKLRTEVSRASSGYMMDYPKRLTMPELFSFPGSKFVEDILVMLMLRPLPKDPSFIGEVSDPDVEELEETMLDLYEKLGEWTGIPTMVTMKMTKWLAENIFACPLIVFDKIFVNLIQASLENEFSNFREAMDKNFQSILQDVFPNLEDAERADMSTDASREVLMWIKEELRDNFLAQPVQDAAKFSHVFFLTLVNELKSYDADTPPAGFLKKVMDASTTDVVCESSTKNDENFKQGIQVLTKKLEMQGTQFWINKLEEYFMDQVPMEQKSSFTIEDGQLENLSMKITRFILNFLEIVGENNEKMESSGNLKSLLVDALGKDYSNLINVLFDKMGVAEQEMPTERVVIKPSRRYTKRLLSLNLF